MKRLFSIILILLSLGSIAVATSGSSEEKIHKVALLEELGKKSSFSKEESLVLRDTLIEVLKNQESSEERFMVIDKVIEDKSKSIDELQEKLVKLEDEIKFLKVTKDDENMAELGKVYVFLKEYGAVIVGVIAILYLILVGVTISLSSKNRKIFEEYKELLELSNERKGNSPVKLQTKKTGGKGVDIIPGLIKNVEEEEEEVGFFKRRNGSAREDLEDLEDLG